MPTSFTKKIKNLFFRFYFFVLRIVGFITGKHFVINQFNIIKPDFIAREIAKNMVIKSGWTNFPLQPPLEVKKDFQQLGIYTEDWEKHHEYEQFANEKIELDFSKIVLKDGSKLNLKVQLIDDEGKNHDLKFVWSPNAIAFQEILPKSQNFVELRIFSDTPFKAYRINYTDVSEHESD